jgi:hypothetical protein
MQGLKEKVIHKVEKLPENRVSEVLDFVDFISKREEAEAWEETQEILKNKKLMKSIRAAEKDLKTGKVYRWEDIKKYS